MAFTIFFPAKPGLTRSSVGPLISIYSESIQTLTTYLQRHIVVQASESSHLLSFSALTFSPSVQVSQSFLLPRAERELRLHSKSVLSGLALGHLPESMRT